MNPAIPSHTGGHVAQRFSSNIIGGVGLIACASIGLLDALGIWFAGPKIIRFIPLPLASLAEVLAYPLSTVELERQSISFSIYLVLYALLLTVLAAAFWLRTKPFQARSPALDTALLMLQIVIGAAVNQELLYLVAAELAFVLARRTALLWLAAQMAILVAAQLPFLLGLGDFLPRLDRTGSILDMGISLAWMSVAFGVGYLAAAEKHGRIRLAGAHAELLATQQLLTGAIRASERVRIARDLHDAIGHHLTALNLHLDLALRHSGERAIESVHTSRALAQRLLSEVRVVVGAERKDQAIDLQQALTTLCSGIPRPRIVLAIDGDVEITLPSLAHTIFCCVQEAISNAVRHSGATMLHIDLANKTGGLEIAVVDNGKGRDSNAGSNADGNGLQGIRERVAEFGGRLETGNLPGGGFRLLVWLPQPGAPA